MPIINVGVYRNYGLLGIRKEGRKARKKEERKTLFYTDNILKITWMKYVKFNQIFGLGMGMSRNLRFVGENTQ